MVINGIARRTIEKTKNSVSFNSDVHEWTCEDILCIGY